MQGGKTHAAGLAKIGVKVSAGHLAQGADQLQEAAVGAVGEQAPMPGLVQLDDPGDIAPGALEFAGQVSQGGEALGGEVRGKPEREGLEHRQDPAHVAQLVAGEAAEAKAAAGVGVEYAFSGELEEGLADGGSADAKLSGQCRVLDSSPRREVAAVDAV